MNKPLYILILLVLSLCFSCTVSKRQYRKGFYITWKASKTPVTTEKNRALPKHEPLPEPTKIMVAEASVSAVDPLLSVSVDKNSIPSIRPKPLKVLNDSCGDVMTFRDGNEQYVRVYEASDDFIKYKPCNNLDGPIRVTKSESVFMIRYLDGRKRVFKEKPLVPSVSSPVRQPTDKRTNGFAVASFVCAMLSFLFIPAVPALLFGVLSLDQMKKYPDTYKGKWMAVAGVIVGGIMTFFLALLLLANA